MNIINLNAPYALDVGSTLEIVGLYFKGNKERSIDTVRPLVKTQDGELMFLKLSDSHPIIGVEIELISMAEVKEIAPGHFRNFRYNYYLSTMDDAWIHKFLRHWSDNSRLIPTHSGAHKSKGEIVGYTHAYEYQGCKYA